MLIRSRQKARRGFSLIELFIAMAVMAILMSYITQTFTMQYQTYAVVDQVSETQNNTIAITALMERDIRNAGYMVPVASAACGIDSSSGPDILFVSDAGAILPVDQLPLGIRGSRLKSEVTGISLAGTVLQAVVDELVLDQDPTYDIDGDGTNDSDYQVNAGAIIIDGANTNRGVACGFVTSVDTANGIVEFDVRTTSLSGVAANPQDLWLVPAIVYNVTTPSGATQPEIQRNGQTLARDVEDLQVAWFFDDDNDGNVDTLEYRASALSVMTPSGSVAINPVPATNFVTSTVDGTLLREIRINIVARTRADDPRKPNSAGVGQARENRTTGIPGTDGRRRRVHSATVRLRNLS